MYYCDCVQVVCPLFLLRPADAKPYKKRFGLQTNSSRGIDCLHYFIYINKLSS